MMLLANNIMAFIAIKKWTLFHQGVAEEVEFF